MRRRSSRKALLKKSKALAEPRLVLESRLITCDLADVADVTRNISAARGSDCTPTEAPLDRMTADKGRPSSPYS